MKLIDAVDESISVAAQNLKALRGTGYASFSGPPHRFSCIYEVFLWYRRREDGNWKEKCWVEALNSQRGNERWWVVTIHPSTKNVLPLRWPSTSCPRAPSQLSVIRSPGLRTLDSPGPHQAALPNLRAVTLGSLNLLSSSAGPPTRSRRKA